MGQTQGVIHFLARGKTALEEWKGDNYPNFPSFHSSNLPEYIEFVPKSKHFQNLGDSFLFTGEYLHIRLFHRLFQELAHGVHMLGVVVVAEGGH